MRKRLSNLLLIIEYLGALFWVFAVLLLVPLVPLLIYRRAGEHEVSAFTYVVPSLVSFGLGCALKWRRALPELRGSSSMLLCALGWVALSAVAAIPFSLGWGMSYLDAYFESVSGFTTTGITMLTGLDRMPKSLLFWRAFIQWLGGLGILTFFLLLISTSGSAHRLFTAESHKIFSKRPAPGLFSTLKILWSVYALFTLLIAGLLVWAGSSVFDAVAHAFTCLSTGGYSPYDASIGHYAANAEQYPHFVAIEYIIILGMVLGGTNFFIHYRVLKGGIRALWDNSEMRLWWGILAICTLLVATSHWMMSNAPRCEAVRHSLFQVVSVATTTGFATKDINFYPPLAKQILLVLMVIGGCVGSTGGGIKVLRISVLFKMVDRQVRRIVHGRSAVTPVILDGERVDAEEIRRISALFFAWMVLLAIGGGITALLSSLGPMEAASGMFSALGNIGPCYMSVKAMTELHPIIKVTYIIGMLAGRLEVLPLLLLFRRRAWS